MPIIKIRKLWNEPMPARRKKSACAPLSDPLSDFCAMSRKPSLTAPARTPLSELPAPSTALTGRRAPCAPRGFRSVCFPARPQLQARQGCSESEDALHPFLCRLVVVRNLAVRIIPFHFLKERLNV